MDLKPYIRNIPDFPKPGVLFRDITPILLRPEVFSYCVETFVTRSRAIAPDLIVAIESRGFIFGPTLAYKMNLPFVPIRKSGKLPYHTEEVKYELEYGSDILQIHADAIRPGQRVLLVDDLIATGGTIRASQNLIEKMGGTVSGENAVILLKELCKTEILEEENLFYLVEY